jgi:hypothetical protein
VYELGNLVSEVDLPSKLLILLRDECADVNCPTNEDHLLWAIDHGFEFIEIFQSRLVEGESGQLLHRCVLVYSKQFLFRIDHDQRDKVGLPRLLEALQSSTWSTMRKKTIDCSPGANLLTITTNEESTKSSDKANCFEGDEEDTSEFEFFAQMMAQV